MADNITVSIKVRPLIKREKDTKLPKLWRIHENTIAQIDGTGEPFVFDNIFDETVSTRQLFDKVCRPIVESALNGFNGTIFAYGQTSSGKTYTMMGDEQELGVVTLTARELFKKIENSRDRQFLIRVGYIEIYNEKIFDLLDKSNANLKIFDNQCGGDVLLNYKEVITNCSEQIMQLLEEGNKAKRIGDTNMNERSSRSHTIFRITIESREIGRNQNEDNDAVHISTLNLVDLAGSERADQTGATGSRLKEGSHINKSLLSLSCVIQKLSENADNLKYINYRDSKLTRILQASLGGNAVTSMICNITPAALEESYYTLSFAMRAKTIKNKPKVNEVLSEAAMMKRLEQEIKRLQEELKSEQSKNSRIKTVELQNAIETRANQIINSQAHFQFDKSRRRTWCPSNSAIPKPTAYTSIDAYSMPPPPPFLNSVSSLTPSSASGDDTSPTIRPELANHCYPDILARKVRSTTPNRQYLAINPFDAGDEFIPGELADFGEGSPQRLARDIHTPLALKNKRRSRRSSTGDSPANFIDYENRCRELEQELRELQEFTNLEKNLDLANIKQQLQSHENIKDTLKLKADRADEIEERCKDFEIELQQKREQIFDMEKELIVARKEREAAVKEAEHCRNLQSSVQVEYELFQQRAKNREKELIESLQEARSSGVAKGGDNHKLLDATRKELKQLEVHNYELQLQLERCNVELDQLRKASQEQMGKLRKIDDVLAKDVARKDAKRLFRVVMKLRAILADEDLLLINTSIDSDEMLDNLGDSILNDSLDRDSPTKIVLTGVAGQTNVIHENGNSQMLDMDILNGELRKKVKTLEDKICEMKKLLEKYDYDCRKLDEKERQMGELAKQVEYEQAKAKELRKMLEARNTEFDKLTAEYDELSTQVIDNIQDMDNYRSQIEELESKLLQSSSATAKLTEELESLRETSSEQVKIILSKTMKIDELEVTLERSSVIIDQLNEDLESIRKKSTDGSDVVHEKNKTIQLLEQKLEDSSGMVAKLNRDLESLRKISADEIEILKGENKIIRNQLEEVSGRIIALETECEALKMFKTKYESAAIQIENLEKSTGEHSNEKRLLEQRLTELSDLRQQLDFLKTRNNDLEEAKIELEKKLQYAEIEQEKQGLLKTHIEEQQLKLSQLYGENHDLTVAVQELSAKIVSLEEQMVKDENESINDSIRSKHDSTLQAFEEANPSLQQMEATVRALEQEKEQLLRQLTKVQEGHDDLATKHEDAIESHKSLRAEQQNMVAELEKKIEQLNEQNDQLQASKLEQESFFQSLSDKFNVLEKEKSDLLEQIKLIREDLECKLNQADSNKLESQVSLQKSQEELQSIIEEKNLLVQQIESIKQEHQTMMAELSKQIEQLNEQNGKLHESKLEQEGSLQLLSHKFDALEKEKSVLLEQIKMVREELQASLQESRAELQSIIEEKNLLVQQVDSLKEEVQTVLNEKKKAEEKCESLCNELSSLITEKEQHDETDRIALKNEMNILQQAKLDKEQEFNALKSQVINLELSLSETSDQKEKLAAKLQSVESELEESTNIRQRLEREVKSSKTDFENLELQMKGYIEKEEYYLKQLCEYKQHLEEKTDTIERGSKEQSELRNTIVQLEQKMALKQQESTEQMSIVKGELMEKIEIAERCSEEQKAVLSDLRKEKDELSKQLHETSIEREDFAKQIAEKNARLENISQQVLSLEDQLVDVKMQNAQIILGRTQIEKAKNDLELEVCSLKQKCEQKELENSAKLNEIEMMKKQISKLNESMEDIQKQLSEKCVQFQYKENAESTARKQIEDTIEQIETLEQCKAQLLSQLDAEKKRVLFYANDELPSLKTTIKQLCESEKELKTKLADSAEVITHQSREIQRLTELCEQKRSTNQKLSEELEEARLSPPLQSDGRPSLGDSRVAQALRKENEDLLKQLNEVQKVNALKMKQLQDKLDEMKHFEVENIKLKEDISTMRHDLSFQEKETQIVELTEKINHYELVCEETTTRHRSLQRQNDELRVKHQNLVMEMDDLRRIADKDRRSRRQSTHDDRRGVLFNTKDRSTMTDPSSTDCGCIEMDNQIRELKRQLTIKNCQLNTQKMMAATNPLKNDVIELRNLVKDREMEIFKLQNEIQTLSVTVQNERKLADKRCSNCVRQERMRSLRSDKAVLTDRDDSMEALNQTKKLEETQEELRNLNEKYQNMKRLCRIRNEKIASLSQDIMEKENESNYANKSVQQEIYHLKSQLKESEHKALCMQRMLQGKCGVPKVDKLMQTEPSRNAVDNDELDTLRTKYEKYKNMAIALLEQNEDLRRKLSSPLINSSNT
ncbi:centromere-associated protein E isoform X2 [Toxorhynchites rutilus septentrionalis]|nr:centromere-associated protein E isoform X2 [Toxorhynchites rutilus septentrionalis]XP_055622671.1 centromere-associated protein E isoform X2 [Toxorhynchites rutilus septentrionalis]XP_055622672.1 centromere-associated protein E isoform X2 [Toxorhynchites rutilus septentrionalis]XP_055622673.1 centromere-associated protein E isoform X2 [Toxorhynchites rutilus septentrionalis]XP_055622674.1 centromere-associated protein E isoform X2 [Toxorhynchites rutilus septentrionalis]